MVVPLTSAATPQTPPDTVIYAIGDVHGRLDLLRSIQQRIADDARHRATKRAVVVYLGDYVSRGEDSRGVVDCVMQWRPDDFEVVTLKGNHEDLLLRFIGGELEAGRHWFDYGGHDTLAGYGVAIADRQDRRIEEVASLRERFAAALPPEHLAFFRSLLVAWQEGDYCFVHGGVRPGVPLSDQTDHDRMWIRKPFLDSDANHGAIIVHGHSISAEPTIRRNRIGIDTGAYRSNTLTCLVLEGEKVEFLRT